LIIQYRTDYIIYDEEHAEVIAVERSSPASLGLINARTGAGLERNTAAPAD
jgi:hypothetical protein